MCQNIQDRFPLSIQGVPEVHEINDERTTAILRQVTSEKTRLHPSICIILSQEDCEELGYDVSNVDQAQFDHMADKIGQSCMNDWWLSLETVLDDNSIPRNKKRRG